MPQGYRNKLEDILSNKKIVGDCWEYQGKLDKGGYGTCSYEGEFWRVHRLSYYHYKGSLNEQDVLHTCDNPKCFNPAHLFLGTHTDNMQDMSKKGRQRTPLGIDHPQTYLSEQQVREIKQSKVSLKELSIKYNTTMATISNIRRGKTWKHIKE